MTSACERLYFESIGEHRDGYMVNYHPPIIDTNFSVLSLTILDDRALADVEAAMLEEMRIWIARYPVSIMVSAWDATEEHLPMGKGPWHQLVGWIDAQGVQQYSWDLDDMPRASLTEVAATDLRKIFSDVPFRTDAQVKAGADLYVQERRRDIRRARLFMTMWVVVIPAGYAIFEYVGPEWFGTLVLLYALWSAYREARIIWGVSKPSKRQQEKAEKELQMRHHHYHCERNPIGFSRLVSENFAKDAAERTRQESQTLLNKAPPKP